MGCYGIHKGLSRIHSGVDYELLFKAAEQDLTILRAHYLSTHPMMHTNQKTIFISTLPQVTTPEQFFSTERIVIPIAIPLGVIQPQDAPEIVQVYGGMFYQGKTYIPTAIFGSPENLFLRVQQGIPFKFLKLSGVFRFYGELNMLLERNLIYDASAYNEETSFGGEDDFYLEKCIKDDWLTVL